MVTYSMDKNLSKFRVMVVDKMWSTEEGNGKLLQYSCLENPMNCSMPGLPVHHQFLEFAQTHVH